MASSGSLSGAESKAIGGEFWEGDSVGLSGRADDEEGEEEDEEGGEDGGHGGTHSDDLRFGR